MRTFPEEHEKHLSEPHKGKQTSEESRSKMSEPGKDESRWILSVATKS
ncbi:MAG: hypothetical protein FIO02_08840 [Nitrosopumilales archaeon]|nr:hypothetical protein [Nitrosopumilales archaeon]